MLPSDEEYIIERACDTIKELREQCLFLQDQVEELENLVRYLKNQIYALQEELGSNVRDR